MENIYKLEQQISEIMRGVLRPCSAYGDIDTCTILFDLALKAVWDRDDLELVEFISKRLEISKKLFLGYYSDGHKAVNTVLTDEKWLEIAVAILLKITLSNHTDHASKVGMKRFNVLFKALNLFTPKWLSTDSSLGMAVESYWSLLLINVSSGQNDLSVCNWTVPFASKQDCVEIPLIVLFYEGPIARAYLETIKSLGFRPQKIIELIAIKDVATKKTIGNWLPKCLREQYTASIQRNRIHFWPKKLLKTNTNLVNGILAEVQGKLKFAKSVIDGANSLLPLSDYCDCVNSLSVEGLSDKRLQQYLSEEPAGVILFTGGGIVPNAVLSINHLKYLHIHPGFLPDIRGADCALWSILLKGHASATCFYMAPGIDTGDVICPRWLPRLSFDVSAEGIDIQFLYRAIYGFLDPWIRAFVLREVINSNKQFDALNSVPQSMRDGTTYHFMHERLQKVVMQQLFHSKTVSM